MAVSFEPVRLDAPWGDSDARLALDDGQLFAVLTCLGELHGEIQGQWFVEAAFGERVAVGQLFTDLDAVLAHVGRAPGLDAPTR